MIAVGGIAGKTGSVVATALRRRGKPIVGLARTQRSVDLMRLRGVPARLAPFEQNDTLTRALAGAEAAYLLIPRLPCARSTDWLDSRKRIADSLAAAVRAAGVPRVVLLSCVGSQNPAGLQVTTAHAEAALRSASRDVTVVRAANFMEDWLKVLTSCDTLNTWCPPETLVPIVSAKDAGEVAARCLLEPAPSLVEVDGPRAYSTAQIAEAMSVACGRSVTLCCRPFGNAERDIEDMGYAPSYARVLAEGWRRFIDGMDAWEGTPERGLTTLDEALAPMAAAIREWVR